MHVLQTCVSLWLGFYISTQAALQIDPDPLVSHMEGRHGSEANIAHGKPVTLGPGTLFDGEDVQQLVNNSPHDASLSAKDGSTEPVTFTVDLGRPENITAIRAMTHFRGDDGTWAGRGKILISDDGENFELLADRLSGCRVIGTPWDTTLQNHRTHTAGGTTVISGDLDGLYAAKGVRYVRMELPNSTLVGPKTTIRFKPWRSLFTKRWVVNGLQIRTDPDGAGRVIPRVGGDIAFDPELSDWKHIPALTMNEARQFRSGTWPGPDRLSGSVKLALDDQNLYVAADVTQNGPAVNTFQGSDAISKDCVELFLNLQDLRNVSRIDYNAQICELAWSGTETESGFEYHLVLNPGNEESEPQIWFMPRTSGLGAIERARVRGTNGAAADGGKIRIFNKADGTGYVIGAAIPLGNFGQASFTPGMQIGVDAGIRSAASGQLAAMTHQSGNPSIEVGHWDRAFLFERQASPSGGNQTVINVDADVVRSFNGHDTIVRETFGVQPNESVSTPMRDVWQKESGLFGRVYMQFGYAWGGWSFEEFIGKSEEEKRAMIYDPEFWKRVDMDKTAASWAQMRRLAEIQPDNLFILLACRAYQLEAEPVFGTRPPTLTPEQQALVEASGQKRTIDELMLRAGEDDAAPMLNKDRDLYAEFVVNIIAKVKEMMPDTRISLTLGNEMNGIHNHASKKIMEDFFATVEKYGDYRAGPAAAEEWLSLYNVLYKKVKARFPDVQVGGPDVIGIHFTWEEAGRLSWFDFVVPVLDGAVGLDFFDFHYALNPEVTQIFLELADQYMQQNRGWSVRSVDSESGSLTWHKGSASVTQYMNTLKNQQEWFGYLRNPDLTFGWAPIDMPSYYDGFGQAKIPALGRSMFMTLRGRYVEVQTDSPDIETVASMDGEKVICVALNNRGKHRDVEFRIRSPRNTGFESVQARITWFDPRAEEARCAAFEPKMVSEAEGLAVRLTLPPFGTCALDAVLKETGRAGSVNRVRRHIADRVTKMVEPGETETFHIEVPAEDLLGNKRYLLRVGYEGTYYQDNYGYVGVRPAEAQVDVNGVTSFALPPYRKSNGFGRCHSIELELDRSVLREQNELTFSAADNGHPFMAVVASIIVQDRTPSLGSGDLKTVSFDVSSPSCTITREPSLTLPDWYAPKGTAPEELPDPVAHWSFDRREGERMPDDSGNGHDGKLLNDARLAAGIKGTALKLGGGAAMVVESPTLFQTKQDGDFAVSLWFKLHGPESSGVILMKSTLQEKPVVAPWGTRYANAPGVTQSVRLAVQYSGGEWGTDYPVPSIAFNYSSPIFVMNSQARTGRDLADGEWHHLVAVKDGTQHIALVYLDGEYAGSGPGWIGADLDFTDPLFFGVSTIKKQASGASYSSTDSFDGLIDEAAIYDELLTPEKVARLFETHCLSRLSVEASQ